MVEKHKTRYFSTKSDKKAGIVERFNRTLKTAMWKYFYSKGTYKWIDILDQLVYNHNTKHNTILTKTKCGQLYMVVNAASPLPKFKAGDTVQTSKYKSVFTKGYKANFTEELFKVIKVICV